jgi:excisionase family DNA binding protein
VDDLIPAEVLNVARALVAAGLAGQRATEPAEKAERPPLTVPEAAEQLRVHESTLYRAIQLGRLGAFSVGSGGRAIRIPADELDAFKARKRVGRQAVLAS